MPQFDYVAKTKRGKTEKGRVYAIAQSEVVARLRRKGLYILSVKEIKKGGSFWSMEIGGGKRKPIKHFELMVFCKQLSSMIKGGVPFVNAIDTIALETKNKNLYGILGELSQYIREGLSFSEALKRFGVVFTPLFIAIIEAGEKIGAMDVMLDRLAKYLEARDRLNKKLMQAVTYPAVIIIFFIAAMLGITLGLIPKFREIYSDFGAQLPTLTRRVFGISQLVQDHICLILIVSVLVIFLFRRLVRSSDRIKLMADTLILNIPVFGDMLKKGALSKFTRTLSTLLEEGISVTTAMNIVSRTAGNRCIEKAGNQASKYITEGDTIPIAFKKSKIFPPLMIQMTQAGVHSGNLPELLDRTADFYEDQVEVFLNIMSSLIEPIIIAGLGGMILIVVVALYMPIFSLGRAVMHK